MKGPYLDTSALAKWYLNEPFSEKFADYIQGKPSAGISRLTIIELRCLLARRRRSREISLAIVSRVYAAFQRDVGAGFLHVFPVEDERMIEALDLIHGLRNFPLRTLDALHLAIAKSIGFQELATADRIMASAAAAAGLEVVRFS